MCEWGKMRDKVVKMKVTSGALWNSHEIFMFNVAAISGAHCCR